MTAADRIAEAVAAVDFGLPSAAKRGRNPRFPYVPIIDHRARQAREGGFQQTEQIRGLAFATRDEAVTVAGEVIDQARRRLAAKLGDPVHRALREHHGLPRELGDLEAGG